ncbi:MAG TPA: glycine oxidase ThiO [Terriglobales bacterium]|nr:glycine oxidase ThiO [Terriglobales bacterium]
MKSWDTIIIGAGIIGLSLAIELNKLGLRVLVVEKGEPGREASWAAGGMLCDFPAETRPQLRKLAVASAAMYPEFVHELEDESGSKIDLRSIGTLLYLDEPRDPHALDTHGWVARWRELEPNLEAANLEVKSRLGVYLQERCVDPRDLTAAAIAAARHRGIDFSCGDQVLAVETADGEACGVRTNKTRFGAGMVVNCAGAWAGQIGPHAFPTRPVKGQMLCVIMPEKELVQHVIRTPEVYLIPRSDGRMLIGATAEEAGFDKRTVPDTVLKLRQAALDLVPKLAEARILEAWAGLRPGTPDGLPILGATPTPGYFVATGHFRDGILLAPVTAKLMGQIMTGQSPPIDPAIDLSELSADRFAA